MYLHLNCNEKVFDSFTKYFINDNSGQIAYLANRNERKIMCSPNVDVIKYLIGYAAANNITVKFAIVGSGVEYDIEDWNICNRSYCGIINNNRIVYKKRADYTSYSFNDDNDYYKFVDFIFDDNFDIIEDGQDFTDFINELKSSNFELKKIIYDKSDFYKYYLSNSNVKVIRQICETFNGYDERFSDIERNIFPKFLDSIRTAEIKEIFDQDLNSNEKILFFDLETNGLPKDVNSIYGWPEIVQASWVLYKCNGELIDYSNNIIFPDNYTISQSSTNIHGISNNYAIKQGKHYKDVIASLLSVLNNAKIIVGHNIEFDLSVLLASLARYHIRYNGNEEDYNSLQKGIFSNRTYSWSLEEICNLFLALEDTRFSTTQYFSFVSSNVSRRLFLCTMKESAKHIFTDNKWRSLLDLYIDLFGKEPAVQLHNSLNDIWVTKQCFHKMVDRKIFTGIAEKSQINGTLFAEIDRLINPVRKLDTNFEDDNILELPF